MKQKNLTSEEIQALINERVERSRQVEFEREQRLARRIRNRINWGKFKVVNGNQMSTSMYSSPFVNHNVSLLEELLKELGLDLIDFEHDELLIKVRVKLWQRTNNQ